MSSFKRKKRKIKTVRGYLKGDGPRGNSKKDQTKQEVIQDLTAAEDYTCQICGSDGSDEDC